MAIGHPAGRSAAFAALPNNRRYCIVSASMVEKNENNVMELNRETAMRLWVKHFRITLQTFKLDPVIRTV